MEIRTETTNGKTKYFVNGKEYSRLEDIPEEFRSHFKDANNNGIPDQMDDLFDVFNGNVKSSSVTNALRKAITMNEPQELKEEPEQKKEESNTYNRSGRINEVNPGTPTWVKVLIGVFIGLLIAWGYMKYYTPN